MTDMDAMLGVLIASVTEEYQKWKPSGWRGIASADGETILRCDGSRVEMRGIEVYVPWIWKRRLRNAVTQCLAKQTVDRFRTEQK